MQKNIILLLLSLIIAANLSAQTCFPDTLFLTSQQAINDFPIDYPDCTEVLGIVLIEETSDGDITNLEGLNQLTLIHDHLIIRNNTALLNFSGLENIEGIGRFSVLYNNSLTSFVGLENLQSVGEQGYDIVFEVFEIIGNPSLINLQGLTNLERAERWLRITENNALVSLDGLESFIKTETLSLRSCPSFTGFGSLPSLSDNSIEYLNIRNCNNLTSLIGLESLTKMEHVYLWDNDNLINVDGLENLDTLNRLTLEDNPLLSDLDGLSNLEDLSIAIRILFNNSITSIAALQNNADSLGELTIRGNDMLTSLVGLSSYEFVKTVEIGTNASLVDFSGLEGLKEVKFDAEIYGNTVLQNCNGLQSLEKINGLFHWNSNTALNSFEGLNSLKKVGELFWIRSHPNLIDLTGLEELDTIGQSLWIQHMDGLQTLDGLEGLEYAGGSIPHPNGGVQIGQLSISNNLLLSDISAISGASMDSLEIIGIGGNPLLEVCSHPNICSYIMTGRTANIVNNALGCNNKGQVIQECFEDLDHSSVVGTVSTDINLDCEVLNDNPIPNNIIAFSNDSVDWQINTNEMGEYWMPLLQGEWTAAAVSPSSFWTSCVNDTILDISALGDTINIDFPLQPMGDCSFIEWDMSYGDMRVCSSNTFVIDYCNYGTTIAEDLIITVSLDTFLTFENSSAPHTIDGDGNIVFLIDDLALFECDQLSFSAFVDCDSLDIWDVQCVEVSLLSEELCPSDSLWDGSIIKVNGYCENDSIYFELENIGDGDMSEPAQFRVEIVIDDIILFLNIDDYILEAAANELLAFPVGNSTGMRIEADQSPGFPGTEQEASAVVANCNAVENNEIYTILPNGEDGDPFNEIFCGPVVNSFDPNDKSAVPEGLTHEHLIDKDWTLDYRVRFQNTGNAQANLVVIRDLLSNNLDLNTLEIKGASHPFTWQLMPSRELIFTFDNIMLPDSNANEPASHGFVSFSVKPKTTLLPGTEIENTAGIYFDFNEAIITNTVRHKLRKPIVTSSEHQDFCIGGSMMGIEIWADTSLQFLTEGTLYDSLHFLHLDVGTSIANTVNIEVPIGEILAGTEIEGDTTFIVEYQSQFGCDSTVTYNVESLVSGNEPTTDFDQITIYPNPTADVLNILNHKNDLAQAWRLVNTLGQAVWQRNLISGESLPPVNVENQSPGIYLLEVKTKRGVKLWKIMIE